jgi:hypothetical protein
MHCRVGEHRENLCSSQQLQLEACVRVCVGGVGGWLGSLSQCCIATESACCMCYSVGCGAVLLVLC